MKIAFIMPQWTRVFEKFELIAQKASSFPPLNLAMLAAVVENSGNEAIIIDAEIEKIDVHTTIQRLKLFNPDLVAFTATTPTFHISSEWARITKLELQTLTAIGGFHITLFAEKAFHDHFDFGFLGEADDSLRKFIKYFGTVEEYKKISGLMFRVDGQIISTGIATPASNLDDLPVPARHLLKTDLYHLGSLKGKHNYTTIMASRGCPFNCVFCTNILGGTKVRRRSVKNVIDEMKAIVEQFGIRHFYFVDDVLTLDRSYIMELCREIHEARLTITFEGSTRANLFDEELAKVMKNAGLIRLSFGLETADETIRTIIKKEIPLESYVTANRISNAYGIENINSVMLGLPGDTLESINKTIEYLRTTKDLTHASFSVAMPYPGTEFYKMAQNEEHGLKLLTEEFSKYQRYGSAVMEVNGITPAEILRLQKIGLLKIYSVPWRLLPVLRRIGLRPLVFPVIDAIIAFIYEKILSIVSTLKRSNITKLSILFSFNILNI